MRIIQLADWEEYEVVGSAAPGHRPAPRLMFPGGNDRRASW